LRLALTVRCTLGPRRACEALVLLAATLHYGCHGGATAASHPARYVACVRRVHGACKKQLRNGAAFYLLTLLPATHARSAHKAANVAQRSHQQAA
jgi:hypothetical protein